MFPSMRRACWFALLAASFFAFSSRLPGQLKKDVVKAPARGGPSDANCPPTARDGSKLVPNAKFGDKDASNHGDGTLDYFMGSWTYTDKQGDDVKVVKWCINAGPTTTNKTGGILYHDYFAFQILTSKAADVTAANPGGETEKVPPGPGSAT